MGGRKAMSRSLGVIDIGSNSTNLLIVTVGNGEQPQTLVRALAVTKLGSGVLRSALLQPDNVAATLAQLSEYRSILDTHAITELYVVTTAAVRSATNAEEFLHSAEVILGVRPLVITGEQEGRLSFIGAQTNLKLATNVTTIGVIDIGGGSTEVVVGTLGSTAAPRVMSIPLGARNLTERELHSNPPRPEELTNAIGAIIDEFDDVLRLMPEVADCDEIIGVAGTIVTVAMVVLGIPEFEHQTLHGMTLTKDAAEDVFRTLATESLKDRVFNPGLSADRADVIVGGCCVIVGMMRKLQRSHIIVSTASLLDGVVAVMGNNDRPLADTLNDFNSAPQATTSSTVEGQ
jgi:exopolyphosphatase/guanosine-5'-triphosphate,3'-diphosphate pyrophosphatase